jgi:hypothetical protein
MSKTKVKRDAYGLYVRGAGYIWRYDFPVGYDHAFGRNPSQFKEGDTVSVYHGGGRIGTISNGDRPEKWYSHGSYYPSQQGVGPQPHPGKTLLTSEQCYRPSYDQWR